MVSEGCYHATAEEIRLFWKDAGAFLVREGREIVIDPVPTAEEAMLRVGVLGPVLGVLLHQRGWLALHASAVATADGIVAFMGEQGQGKSTMAAAMYDRGHRLVADDITAVRIDKATGSAMVQPGFPQLKLWPESVAALGADPESVPRLVPGFEKRARRALREFSMDLSPLRRLYVLAEGETLHVETLEPQKALMELVGHSYVGRILRDVGASTHLLQCSSLVKNVPVRSLIRPRSLSSLPEVVRLVEEDLAQNT
jgi:hypothetical protein